MGIENMTVLIKADIFREAKKDTVEFCQAKTIS